ncbi:MAG: L,D-transpeptidase [Alphaproteobacteria bacterium]|nr:L,D-transpeptidase [Alphaproteobacteria bacterium]MBV9062437.1 L,D-transpeptidase [Alphaproteobacteria bacterium]
MSIYGRAANRVRVIAAGLFICGAVTSASYASTPDGTLGREPDAKREQVSAVTNSSEDFLGDVNRDDVVQHLKESLTSEAIQNFGLFVYVNKSGTGPHAQRMYVFEKTEGGELALRYDWPVSTGRERLETDAHGHLQSTATPQGFYQLDPARLYSEHVSGQWDEPMPYAMFFNWAPNGRKTGLAIHGTSEEESRLLGTPASAGCVRLSQDNARTLFDLVRTQFRSPVVPKLAYLDGETNVSSRGTFLHDRDGRLQVQDGYSVLVAIDEYDGESQTTAQR